MSDEIATPEAQQQGIQLIVDDREVKTVYANAYRINTAPEEVIVDLGFNMPQQGQAGQPPSLLFKVSDRVVLTYVNAKRLATSLQQLIKRYEQQFGELPLTPGPRR